MLKQTTILIALFALAACGDNKSQQTITTPDGSTVKIEQKDGEDSARITSTSADGSAAMTTGGGWPKGAADYAPAYPGATVVSSMLGSSSDGAGGMIAFETADPPARIVEFYQARAKSAGLSKVTNMDINGAKMFGATDEKTGRSVSIQASVADGKTSAAITFGTTKN